MLLLLYIVLWEYGPYESNNLVPYFININYNVYAHTRALHSYSVPGIVDIVISTAVAFEMSGLKVNDAASVQCHSNIN